MVIQTQKITPKLKFHLIPIRDWNAYCFNIDFEDVLVEISLNPY